MSFGYLQLRWSFSYWFVRMHSILKFYSFVYHVINIYRCRQLLKYGSLLNVLLFKHSSLKLKSHLLTFPLRTFKPFYTLVIKL